MVSKLHKIWLAKLDYSKRHYHLFDYDNVVINSERQDWTNNGNAAIDASLSLSALILVWFLCEWVIRRRRAARKGA
jgi:hypothetical protein